jgi:type IV secretion system protein VirD4
MWNRGSVLVNDPKGELYRATAEKRRAMGQRVVRLDPFSVCGPGGDTFNPLDLITDKAEGIDDARALAEALVVRTGEEKDPFWNDPAANILTAGLACILAAGEGSSALLPSCATS